jgi:hypothetical protein
VTGLWPNWVVGSVVSHITPQVRTVFGEVHSVFIQIAPDAVDLALLVAAARVPCLGRTEIAVPDSSKLALQSIVPLRSLFA